MAQKLHTDLPMQEGTGRKRYLAPELVVDLEADNALLRAALALSVDDSERRELVTQELEHRIGNLLAVVTAIARHTFAAADVNSVADFSARLLALGAAQKVLINAEKRAASFAEVVRGAIAAICEDGDRAKLSGPDIPLDGRCGHALTLALHELTTNAAKYGALSVGGGWVEVTWAISGGLLDLLWREHAGPLVLKPTRRGFGMTLITRNLALAFAGKVDLDFQPDGLQCRLIAPVPPLPAAPK